MHKIREYSPQPLEREATPVQYLGGTHAVHDDQDDAPDTGECGVRARGLCAQEFRHTEPGQPAAWLVRAHGRGVNSTRPHTPVHGVPPEEQGTNTSSATWVTLGDGLKIVVPAHHGGRLGCLL